MQVDYIKTLKDSDLKQKEIAKKLGIHTRTLQNYLSGRELPDYVKKLIEHEFINEKSTAKEPDANYISAKDHEIEELKEKLILKDEIIQGLKKNIELLEAKADLLEFQLAQARNGT